MPKAILEFNLPEETDEYETTMNAGKYSSMLWDIAQYRRSLRKYEERDLIPVEEILGKLDELLTDYEA